MKVDIFNTDKKYQIIYADPPWKYRNMGNIEATAEAHYSTMEQADIESLPVADLADKNCILFLWATFPKIQEALNCMKAWGFEYKTVGFTWVKTNKRGGTALALAGTQSQMPKFASLASKAERRRYPTGCPP